MSSLSKMPRGSLQEVSASHPEKDRLELTPFILEDGVSSFITK